jgi:hypothetical protein
MQICLVELNGTFLDAQYLPASKRRLGRSTEAAEERVPVTGSGLGWPGFIELLIAT